MIFVLEGADASANNLGKISIKTVDDLQQSTLDLLTFFGKTWTDDQKIAIDDFLVAFNSATWKTKVKVLTLPILIPSQTGVDGTAWAAGTKFKKNIVGADVTPTSGALGTTTGLLTVNSNGLTLQNGSGGTVDANTNIAYNVSALAINNKAFHAGVFVKASTSYRGGTVSLSSPYLALSSTTKSVIALNNFEKQNVATTAPHKGFLCLNGSVIANTGSSYMLNGLQTDVISGTGTQTTQSTMPIFSGGASQNLVGDTTVSAVTFGDYLTDAELTEYAGLINTLMLALVV